MNYANISQKFYLMTIDYECLTYSDLKIIAQIYNFKDAGQLNYLHLSSTELSNELPSS